MLSSSIFPTKERITSIVVIGLVAIVSLYLFYIYSEQRRLDARLSVVSSQLSLALKTTQQSVEEMQARLGAFESFESFEGGFPEGFLPILFGGSGSPIPPPPPTTITEVVQVDEFEEENDSDSDEDDERLRKVLVGGEDLEDVVREDLSVMKIAGLRKVLAGGGAEDLATSSLA